MTESPNLIETDYRDPRELRPHPDNPRGEIDPASPEVVELTGNIRQNGMIQPIVISSTGVVHAGHRRRVAAIAAGLDLVPVVVKDLQGGQLIEEIFLAENMQRQDLSPLEEARAIAAIKHKAEKKLKKAITNKGLSRRLSIPAETIRQRLTILTLPERVQHLFHICELPVNTASQLGRIREWPEEVERFADRLVTRQITARSLAALIDRRIKELQQTRDNEAIIARAPRMERIQRQHPEGLHTPPLTREVVMENLSKKGSGAVSLFNLKLVMDSTCCSCGMIGQSSVCLSCPLPRFVNGLLGRAETNGNKPIDRDEGMD